MTNQESSENPSSDLFQAQVHWICGKPHYPTEKCVYHYGFSHNEEEVPQALPVMNIMKFHTRIYVDTGATRHMTNDPRNLISCSTYKGNDKVHIGIGVELAISHTGKTILSSSTSNVHLQNVLVVPKIMKNLYL